MLMPGAKTPRPIMSFKKLTPRAIDAPEIALAKWPTNPFATRGSYTIGTDCDLTLRGLRRPTARSPARFPMISGLSRSSACRALALSWSICMFTPSPASTATPMP